MSLKSLEARKLAVASIAAIAAAGAFSSTAQAAQTKTLTYACKYPILGVEPLSIAMTLDIPDRWERGVDTPEFGISAVATASGDTSPGLALIDDLTSIEGVSKAFSSVFLPEGGSLKVTVPIVIAPYVVPVPTPDPLVLTASGVTPSLLFDEPGRADITLDKLELNLTARDSFGDPIILPPVTRDIDGNRVSDSDGDPNTFDVYCKLDAGQAPVGQNPIIASFEIFETPVANTAPTAVTNLAADPAETSAALSWTAATDDKAVTGYNVYNGPTKVATVTGTTATVSGLTADTSYTFRVEAFDAEGLVGPVATVTTKTDAPVPPPDTTAPSIPLEVDGQFSDFTDSSILVRWGASTDNPGGSGVKEYVIRWEGDTVRVPAGSLTSLFEGLGADSEYLFEISAVDNAGNESDPLQLLLVTAKGPVTNTPPTAPTNLAGDASETSVVLTWTASTDDKGVVGYDVYVNGGKVQTVTGTTATISGLTANTSYEFGVVAVDAEGAVGSSEPLTVKTDAIVPVPNVAPTAPTNLAGDASETSVALTWTASTDSDGAVVGYDVFNGTTKVTTVTGTSATVSGLTANTSYDFKVVAVDDDGATTSSSTLTVKTDAIVPVPNVAPTAPTNLAGDPAETSVALTWTASTDSDGAVVGYDVFNGTTKVTTVTGTSATVSGLTANTSYDFKVVAVDDDGATTSSSTISVKTLAVVPPPNQAPSKPTNLAGTPTTTSVALSWTASTDDKAVTGYNVFNGTTKVATVTGTSANVTGLTPDTSYTFKVEAFDAEGLKTASDATTVKTNKVVVPPVDAKAPVVKSIIGKVAFAKIGGIALVQGTNFTGVKSVTVGGKPVSVSPLGSNLLLVVLPPLAKGSYPLVVTTAAGASATTSSTTIKYISLF